MRRAFQLLSLPRWALILACLFAVGLSSTPSMAEKRTVSFFSVWEATGSYFATGPENATFIGALEGPVYVETPEGPVEGGRLACPATVEIDVTNARQSGHGKCQFIADDGNIAFTEWSCSGIHMIGCRGEMTITGGTGRFETATGGGLFTIRGSTRSARVSEGGGGVDASFRGIIFWKDFAIETRD